MISLENSFLAKTQRPARHTAGRLFILRENNPLDDYEVKDIIIIFNLVEINYICICIYLYNYR